MLGKISGVLCVLSLIFSFINGSSGTLGQAILDGASKAVTLTISLAGMMCFWSGIMRVLQSIGAIRIFSKLLSPILWFLFPDAYRKSNGIDEISSSVAANILGIGNAATPLAISAMKKLDENNKQSKYASDDMVTFTVLNTACLSLIPATMISLLASAGALDPFKIIIPVQLCSLASSVAAVLFSKGLSKLRKKYQS